MLFGRETGETLPPFASDGFQGGVLLTVSRVVFC